MRHRTGPIRIAALLPALLLAALLLAAPAATGASPKAGTAPTHRPAAAPEEAAPRPAAAPLEAAPRPAAAPLDAAPPPAAAPEEDATRGASLPGASAPASSPTPHRATSRPGPPKGRAPRGGWFHPSYWLHWGLVLAVGGTTVGLYAGTEPVTRSFRLDDPRIGLSHRENTVPNWSLAFTGVVPLAVAGLAQIWERSGQDFHHAALGLAEGLGLTLLVTVVLKNAVGQLRPDFLDRCQPDAQGRCTGDPDLVRRGRDSFPSGHTSLSFAGGVYLSLYLWGKLKPSRDGGALWRILAILAPVVAATLVGVSRITDHRHHWEDVLVGGLVGTGFAYLGYRLHYPDPWAAEAGTPRRRTRWVALPVVGPGTLAMMVQGEL